LDDDWRKELAAGDVAAYRRVCDRYGPAMFRVAMRLVGNPHDAEDAVQDVFVVMVRSRDRLSHVTDMKAYLFASLRHAAGRSRRRPRAVTGLPEDLQDIRHAAVPPEGEAGDERTERLWEMVRRLPPKQRDVLALKIQGELSFKEIGDIFGISANTAASRYRYALEKLQRMAKT